VTDANDEVLQLLARLLASVPPADLAHALEQAQWARSTLTLREALTAMGETAQRIQRSYPTAYRVILDGRPAAAGLPAVEGFGDRPLADLTFVNARAAARAYQELVGAGMSRKAAGRGPRTGARAAGHYVIALRTIDRELAVHGLRTPRQLEGLKEPPRAGPTREHYLTDSEECDFARAVLVNSRDPELDVVLWLVYLETGCRPVEARRLREVDVYVSGGALTLVGKDGPVRRVPVQRPVLQFAVRAMAHRPPAPDEQWLRSRDGTPLTRHRSNAWSEHLHDSAAWARGHRIGPYALRATMARRVRKLCGKEAAGLFLGHVEARTGGTTTTYTESLTESSQWSERKAILRAVLGPRNGWPKGLPEWAILRPFLPADAP